MHGAQLPAHAVNADSYATDAIANAAHPAGTASDSSTATTNGTSAVGTGTGNGSAAAATATATTGTAAEGGRPAIAPAGVIEPLDDAIRHHIERALAQCYGRLEGPFGAARLLAVNPDTLRSRMRKLGISRDPFKP